MPEQIDFSKPERQAPIAILFLLGDTLKVLVRQLWAIILVFFFNPKRNMLDTTSTLILGIGILGGLGSIASWFRYYFYINNGELVLEKGIFRKIKLNVPIDRIQTINFKQSVLHQFFNVIEVDIETAGSKEKEFYLHAISTGKAKVLRAYIEEFRKQIISEPLVPNTLEQPSFFSPQVSETILKNETKTSFKSLPSETLIFSLKPLDLLKIGISQNHLRTAGLILAFFLGFYDDLENALGIDTAKEIEKLLGMQKEIHLIYYALIVSPIFLLLSFLLTLVNTFLKYFNLKFWQTSRGFKMESGLFTRAEFSISLRKVQLLQWNSNPIKKMFGMVGVRIPQASSMVVGRKAAGHLPGCRLDNLEAIRTSIFEDNMPSNSTSLGVSKRVIVRQLFLIGVIPAILLIVFTYSLFQYKVWVWLLWLPAAFMLARKYHKNWIWKINHEQLMAQWGTFGITSVQLSWYKVQALTLNSNFFLQKQGLVHLDVFTAAGSIRIPYIPQSLASELQDFVLFKIETDKRNWM
jgi:putative membrane protein